MSELKKWKTIKSGIVLDNNWLRVRQDTCRLPDNRVVDDYFIIEKPDIVAIFAVTKGRKVLLVKQYKHGIDDILLELPGGYLGRGESPLEAAERELAEETGYTSSKLKEIGILVNDPSNMTNLIHVFLAQDASETTAPQFDTHEELQVELIGIEDLLHLIIAGKVNAQSTVAATFLAISILGLAPV